MDGWGLAWTIVGALAGIGAFAYGVRSYQRTFPKRRLEFVVEDTPLMNTLVPVEVSFKGTQVKHPFLVQVTIASNSRADIPSSSFDSQHPVALSVSDRVVAVIDQDDTGIRADLDGSSIVIPPQLIRTTAAVSLSLLTDGRYRDVRVSNSLIDIEFRVGNSFNAPRSSARGMISIVVSILGMAVIAGVLVTAWLTPLLAGSGVFVNHLLSGV
ncbi:hypothetical protein ACFJGV_17610 [Cnuibacter sp. UC19_7]|uniref:hypothetical protein n=1 Tax=Cnuibacter sp. UC19_7 TaxID=3350166 RepID=UPI00366B27D1